MNIFNNLKFGSDYELTLSNTDYSNMNNWVSFGGVGGKNVGYILNLPHSYNEHGGRRPSLYPA